MIPICLQTVWYLSLNDTAFDEYSFSFLVHSWNISHKLLSTHEPSTKIYYKKYLNNHPMSNTHYSTDQHQVILSTFHEQKCYHPEHCKAAGKQYFSPLTTHSWKKSYHHHQHHHCTFFFYCIYNYHFLQNSIRKVSILAHQILTLGTKQLSPFVS